MQNIIISRRNTHIAPTAEDLELVNIKNGVLLSELDAAEAEIERLNRRIGVYQRRQFAEYRKVLMGKSNNRAGYRFMARDAIHMLIGAGVAMIVFLWVL